MAASDEVAEAERASDLYSDITSLDCGVEGLSCAYIGPPPCEPRVALPTVIAISGGEQHHVSKFFRALRAEKAEKQKQRWQIVVPMRAGKTPLLFEKKGPKLLADFVRKLVTAQILPYDVEAGRFHLIGYSNGAVAALAIAARAPDRFASLTTISGFVPDGVELELAPLKVLPSIQLLVSPDDSKLQEVKRFHEKLEDAGIDFESQIIKKAKHDTIGELIVKEQFWDWLEGAQKRATRAPDATTTSALNDQEPKAKAEAGAKAKARNKEKDVRNKDEDAQNDEKVEATGRSNGYPKAETKAEARAKAKTKKKGKKSEALEDALEDVRNEDEDAPNDEEIASNVAKAEAKAKAKTKKKGKKSAAWEDALDNKEFDANA